MLATVIVGRLRDALDTDAISVRDVLGAPTVAGLAARLGAADGADRASSRSRRCTSRSSG